MEQTAKMPKKRKVVPKEIWEEIRVALSQGVPAEELAAKYCIKLNTIEAVASRRGWLLARKFINEVSRQAESALEMAVSEENSPAPPAVTDWVEAATRYRELIFGKVLTAAQGMALAPPTTWRDAEIMDRMGRKASGLDSGESTVVNTIIPIGKGDFNVERDVSPG